MPLQPNTEQRLEVQRRRKAMHAAMASATFERHPASLATNVLRYLASMEKRNMRVSLIRWDGDTGAGSRNRFPYFHMDGMDWIVGANNNDHASNRKWIHRHMKGGQGMLDYAFIKKGRDRAEFAVALYMVLAASLYPLDNDNEQGS